MAKVTALHETKDFTKCNMEQLPGSFMTHELHLDTENGDMSKQKWIGLKVDESHESEADKEESALMVQKFNRIVRNMKNGDYKGKNKKYTNKPVCHKCGSSNYFIKECL